MTRARRRLAVLAAGLAVAGCGSEPAADPEMVDVLAEVHLADARAALDTSGADRTALADSLRRVALTAHGLDPAALADRLDALAASPDLVRVTYDSVEARLARERRGPPAE